MVDNSFEACENRKRRYQVEGLLGEPCLLCHGVKKIEDEVCLLCEDSGTYWNGKVVDKTTGQLLYGSFEEYGLSMGYSFRPLANYQNKLLRQHEKDNNVKQGKVVQA